MNNPYSKRCPNGHVSLKFRNGYIVCDSCRKYSDGYCKFTHYHNMVNDTMVRREGEINKQAIDVYNPIKEEKVQ
jgi:hypothetical protein